jgi:hypothetical protein
LRSWARVRGSGWAMQSPERVVTDWLDARADEGWYVNYRPMDGDRLSHTFPHRVRDARTGRSGHRMALDAARADAGKPHPAARPYPRVWPAEQGLASPVERLTVDLRDHDLRARPAALADFALDASETILRDVTVTSDAGWRMALPEGRLSMIRQDGQDARYDVTFAARDLAPPGPGARSSIPAASCPTRSKRSTTPPRWNSTAPGTCAPSRIGARRSPRSTCGR